MDIAVAVEKQTKKIIILEVFMPKEKEILHSLPLVQVVRQAECVWWYYGKLINWRGRKIDIYILLIT